MTRQLPAPRSAISFVSENLLFGWQRRAKQFGQFFLSSDDQLGLMQALLKLGFLTFQPPDLVPFRIGLGAALFVCQPVAVPTQLSLPLVQVA